jgi:uncharacterized protein (TIGR02145 family)
MGIYFDQNNKMVFDCRNGSKVMNNNCSFALTDIDGNQYNYITIGSQYWMSTNLKTTHYSDNSPIPNISNYNDWYLPSKDELNSIYQNLFLNGIGNFQTSSYYWSSSEADASHAYAQRFTDGSSGSTDKFSNLWARSIRSFTGSTYSIGDIGPAGGWIFYVSGSTYYECSTQDLNSASNVYSNITGTTCGATGTTIGTGQLNTNLIIAQSGQTTSAALTCDNLTSNNLWTGDTLGSYCWYNNDTGYTTPYGALYNWYAVDKRFDDWFLPSKDELNQMYTQLYLYGVGGFEGSSRWSSSESNATNAWIQTFSDGSQSTTGKNLTFKVRACRSFTSSKSYALRDTGPAGGLIFNITGTTYYEASPSDQASTYAWSNITGTSVGNTSTAIGKGMSNSVYIIMQPSHTSSAASLCLNYTGNQKFVYLLNNGAYDSGWRVPTKTDFDNLSSYLGGDSVAGGKLKEVGTIHWLTPNSGATDNYGFGALPAGERISSNSVFDLLTQNAFFWTSTVGVFIRVLHYDTTEANPATTGKNTGISVRCVKDI